MVAVVCVPFVSFALSDGNLGIGVVYQNDVHPDNLVYELGPGDVFEDEVIISNTGTKPAYVELYVEDKGDGDGKTPNEKQFLSRWVKMEKSSFDFAPRSREIIKFTVTIPSDAEEREYKGFLFVHEPPGAGDMPVRVDDGSGSTVVTLVGRRIGLGMYLTVTKTPHMPPRFKKNPLSEVSGIEFVVLLIAGITIFISALLVLQEKRKVKSF